MPFEIISPNFPFMVGCFETNAASNFPGVWDQVKSIF